MAKENKTDGRYLEKELLAPSKHLARVYEKLLIGRVTWAFNHWYDLPGDKLRQVIEAWTKMINAVVLFDDIQDNASARREQPTAHIVYGIPLTINAAVLVMTESTKIILALSNNDSKVKGYMDQLYDMWVGQGTELYWRNNFICPTEEQYRNMTELKTGTVISTGVRLLQMLSSHEKHYDEFVRLLGYYSQLRDDYCNLCAVELNSNGKFCNDLTEGKFSLPIIHASKTQYGDEVLRILRKRTEDVNLKKYCLSLLEKAGSLQYTRDKLSELDREARKELARLGGNPLLEICLDELSSWRNDRMVL